MKEGAGERLVRVKAAILAAWWRPAGQTQVQKSRTPLHYASARVTVSGGRERFESPDGELRVTVGKVTTFFYRPDPDAPYDTWKGKSFKTREVEAIESLIKDPRFGP